MSAINTEVEDAPFVSVTKKGHAPRSPPSWGGFDAVTIRRSERPIDGSHVPVVTLRSPSQKSWLKEKCPKLKTYPTLWLEPSDVRSVVNYIVACGEEVVMDAGVYRLAF
jgi:hypothetical protein